MPTLNRESIEQELGKRFEKIEKTIERTLEETLKKALEKASELQARAQELTKNSPAAARAQAAAELAQERFTAKAAQAKKSLDDVLLGLEHKGYNVKKPEDLIQTVGRRVLERASEIATDLAQKTDSVRSQVAAKSYSPEWLKNVSVPGADGSLIRPSTASAQAAAAAGAKVSAKESTAGEAGATEAGATEADAMVAASGEADVHAQPEVSSTSLAEASKSIDSADFATAGQVKPVKKSGKDSVKGSVKDSVKDSSKASKTKK